jgi:ATP-binding cassette subfamily B protein
MKKSQKRSYGNILRTSWWVIKIYYVFSPKLTIVYLVTGIIRQTHDIVDAFVLAFVTDRLLIMLKNSVVQIDDLIYIFGLFLGSIFITDIIEFVNNASMRALDYCDKLYLRKMLYEHLATLDLKTLEEPELTNKIHRYLDTFGSIIMHLNFIIQLLGNLVGVISASIVVFFVSPAIIPLYIAIMIPRIIVNGSFILQIARFSIKHTEYRRKSVATANMLSEPASLKEIQQTGAYLYLNHQFEKFFKFTLDYIYNLRRRWFFTLIGFDIPEVLAFGVALYFIIIQFLAKAITIGQVVLYIRTVRSLEASLANLGVFYTNLQESVVRFSDAQDLFKDYQKSSDGTLVLPRTSEPPAIEFKNVSFKYPSGDRYAIRDLNLKIRSGEKVAIVGENGAGKTTLVKLLSRFYQINEGEITVDGLNLKDIKLNDWYDKLGVLFQDFNRYGQLTAKENILLGRPEQKISLEAIKEAARNADTLRLIQQFPNGFEQILDERFVGGLRPSTGQWQKIAIARFFYRDAPILILDEPTAAIDAVAESKIFDSIYDFIKNKTVIIISHRFSTVRKADRIIVFEKGRIIEEGTHEVLMKKNGTYAHAFNLQAEGYK